MVVVILNNEISQLEIELLHLRTGICTKCGHCAAEGSLAQLLWFSTKFEFFLRMQDHFYLRKRGKRRC